MVGLLVCNQEIGVRIPGGPMIRKVAGYGWPDRTANAVLLHWRSGFESLAFRLCQMTSSFGQYDNSCIDVQNLQSTREFRERVVPVGVASNYQT